MSIKITSLNKSYGDYKVLDNLNLEIPTGSLFGLLGPNGAGKTTLVSILNFLIPKNSGTIKIEGFNHDFHGNEIKSISSYVPQTYAFYPKLTTYENLEFFAALYGLRGQKMRDRIDYCIEVTSLEKYVHKKAQTYSGGLKRRLNIAIGLLNDPKILYLDEPTVGIDPQSRNYILNVIKKINEDKNMTIIYTSHYMEEVEFLCDELAILDHGKIVLQDKKENLLKQNNQIKVKLNNGEERLICTAQGYDQLVDELSLIKQNNQKIEQLNYGHKSLEEMFLSLTKQDLRD